MIQYIEDTRNSMKDDTKISIVFSYIQGDKVNDWVQNFLNEYYNDEVDDKLAWRTTFVTACT